eukprot:scaffold9735_cov106-Cylindrotheca_fusiformis.AAC.1
MKPLLSAALTFIAILSTSNIIRPDLAIPELEDVLDGNHTSTQHQPQQQLLRGPSLMGQSADIFTLTAGGDAEDAAPSVVESKEAQFATSQHPRFLLGFFSMPNEVDRRQFMRDSVLRFYKDVDKEDNRTICALNDLLRQDIPECRITYVFIIGGSEGPKRLLTSSEEQPIYTRNILENEPDVVQLNIEENMNDGKTPTYYKYASIMAEQVSADYVAKVDLDTLLFVPNFVKYCQEQFPQTPLKDELQIYAGKPISSNRDGFEW